MTVFNLAGHIYIVVQYRKVKVSMMARTRTTAALDDLDMRGDVDLVLSSIKAVMSCDEQVKCQRDGPDSLKTVADLFLSVGLELPPLNPFHQQAVNRHLFQQLLTLHATSRYPIVIAQTPSVKVTAEEENAIRYASGYLAMKALKKYKKTKGCNSVHFVECLLHMASSGEESSFIEYTRDWIKKVDRGGLFHVNDNTFNFFKSVETKTQELLPKHLGTKADGPNKSDLIRMITEDDDVEFWWSMLAIDILDEAGTTALLNELVDMWVTIRGFAVVSNWLEQYKIAQKSTVKKSKPLRKKLQQQSESQD